jgi:hypothetical protein
MKDLICDEFQNTVDNLLIRHHSVLDVTSKLNEATCRVNRSVIKAVTDCGCVTVEAKKIQLPDNIESISELKSYLDNHLRGQLCQHAGKWLSVSSASCFFIRLRYAIHWISISMMYSSMNTRKLKH